MLGIAVEKAALEAHSARPEPDFDAEWDGTLDEGLRVEIKSTWGAARRIACDTSRYDVLAFVQPVAPVVAGAGSLEILIWRRTVADLLAGRAAPTRGPTTFGVHLLMDKPSTGPVPVL